MSATTRNSAGSAHRRGLRRRPRGRPASSLPRGIRHAGNAAFCALVLCGYAATAVRAEGECQHFRANALVIEHIKDFDLADPERTHVSFIELRYDPAYLRSLAIPPLPDGLPDRERLFSLDALTGAPLTMQERRNRAFLKQQGTVNVMVQSTRFTIDLNAAIRARALAPLDAPYYRTEERLAGYELLKIPNGLRTAPDAIGGMDVFGQFDDAGQVKAVMSCSRPKDVPDPQCSVHFRMGYFHVDVSLIRRTELDRLDKIMTTVRDFVFCLRE